MTITLELECLDLPGVHVDRSPPSLLVVLRCTDKRTCIDLYFDFTYKIHSSLKREQFMTCGLTIEDRVTSTGLTDSRRLELRFKVFSFWSNSKPSP